MKLTEKIKSLFEGKKEIIAAIDDLIAIHKKTMKDNAWADLKDEIKNLEDMKKRIKLKKDKIEK